jgi:hypothetical protein
VVGEPTRIPIKLVKYPIRELPARGGDVIARFGGGEFWWSCRRTHWTGRAPWPTVSAR